MQPIRAQNLTLEEEEYISEAEWSILSESINPETNKRFTTKRITELKKEHVNKIWKLKRVEDQIEHSFEGEAPGPRYPITKVLEALQHCH